MKKVSILFITMVLIVCTSKAQLIVFADDYAPGVSFTAFGGSTNTLSLDMSVKHSGTASLKIPVTAGYTGGALVSAAPTDLSSYNAITFWAKNDMPYLLDGVGLGNNANTTVYAVERNGVTVTSTWTKYYIPLPVASKLTAETGLFHFAEGSGEGMYNIWIDDIQYETVAGGIIGTPTASFATESQNKNVGDVFNANGTTSSYPVNSVNQAMQTARAYFTWASSNMVVATVNPLGVGSALTSGTSNITGMLGTVVASGILTVNVAAAASGPATAAPTPPARLAADYISLFSKQPYNNVAGTDWFPFWGQATVVSEVIVAADTIKKYAGLNYQGVQFATPIDASGMTKLHLDIWTADCAAFEVFLINPGNEKSVTITPTNSGWKSVDIDLNATNFPTINFANIIQFKFVGNPFSGSTVYLDNIYFHKSGVAAPTAPLVAAPTPTRLAAGVISMFSNAYTNVPVDTWLTGWSPSATTLTDTLIAGNATKKYTNVSYLGVEFTAPTVNATNMDFIHIDVWTPNANTFKLKLVDFGADGGYGGGDDREHEVIFDNPVQGSWISYDIPLNSFTGLTTRGHLAQMILSGSNSALFIDNVYFYNAVLPITLNSFNVIRKNGTASITWNTSFEQNNKGFALERSLDGVNFKQINFINGTNSRIGSTYGANDLTPAKGINYYRLKQIDFDGQAVTYAVKSLNFDNDNLAKFALFPNPASDRLLVTLGAIENNYTLYSIVTADGKMVQSGRFAKNLAYSVQSLNVSTLPAGLYFIKMTDGSSVQSAKIKID